jgi:uncharacterized CHY-type Zn-finger protein
MMISSCKIVLPSQDIFKLSPLPKTFDELYTAIKTRLKAESLDNMSLKYMDSDKELVNLCNGEDFETAKITGQVEQLKTLKIYVLAQGSFQQPPIKCSSFNFKVTIPKEELGSLQIQKRCGSSGGLRFNPEQAMKKAKDSSPTTSKTGEAINKLQLIGNQLETIDELIGYKVTKVLEENMGNLLSSVIARLEGQNKTENVQGFCESVQGQQFELFKSCPVLRSQSDIKRMSGKGENLVLDSDQACNECKDQIQGVFYMCLECNNYNCCEHCEDEIEHPHPLLKYRLPSGKKLNIRSTYHIKTHYTFRVPPDKANKLCEGSSLLRKSLSKCNIERKVNYAGEISFENMENPSIKVKPYERYEIVLNVNNIGSLNWPTDVKLCCVNGIYRNREESLLPLEPKAQQRINFSLQAPQKPGKHLTQWRLNYNDGEKTRSFGESFFLEIQVQEGKSLDSNDQDKNSFEETNFSNRKNNKMLKRARTLNLEPWNKDNERVLIEGNEIVDKKYQIAKCLDEFYPGNMREKIYFVDNIVGIEELGMNEIVELYLQYRKRRPEMVHNKTEADFEKQRQNLVVTMQ